MIIFYGDYKDLNYIGDYGNENVSDEETKQLKPFWDMFINGKLNLKKSRIKNDEYMKHIKIFIVHHVFENNEYTTYSIVKAVDGASYYREHCKSYDTKFIDRENGVIVLEKTQAKGKIPKTLEEIKEREIAFHNALLKRAEKGDYDGKDLLIELEKKSIEKWENKSETKWFY